jgi:hypothetical protein
MPASALKNRRLVMGARAIAKHVFGNPGATLSIYEAARNGELPIFKINSRLAAYADALDEVMAAKEQAALDACARRQQVLADRKPLAEPADA